VPLTDVNGNALTTVNPFANSGGPEARPGRFAADELGGTPYGRPEDAEISELGNGREVLYFAATSEQAIYSIELIGSRTATVRLMAKEGTTPKNLGFAATSGVLNSPDNLAEDALGNIYVIEDAPNGSATGGDIWFVRDADSDGVAESLDHFMTIQVAGSEATGMIFNPVKPTQFVVAVQHPNSTDLGLVPNGFGDAIWSFDLQGIVAPPCKPGPRGWDRDVKVCAKDNGQFVRSLERAARRR
jgi:secreted PhoX family phosphatase